jgi:hypothetical protein
MRTAISIKSIPFPLVFVLFVIFLVSCHSKQADREEALISKYRSIEAGCDASSTNEIENTIALIKSYLSDYPNSKRYSEISSYLDKLYECLDVHKLKDFKEKYAELTSNVYIDLNSATQDLQNFLDSFTTEYGMQLAGRQEQIKIYIRDVNEIKNEFESMKSFFERTFSDLATFNSEAQMKSNEFGNSKYETVRLSWKEIVNDYRKEQAQKDMNQMVTNFEDYLKRDAEKLSQYNHDDYVIDGNQYTQTISIGNPYQHDSYNAKVCEGVFRVFLKGAYLGWDKGTVKISVKGMVTVVVNQSNEASGVEYRNLDFRILEETGDLK